MSAIDMDIHKCERCGGPNQEFWDYKDQATTYYCAQCGTVEDSYYDRERACDVHILSERYGVVNVVLTNGFEETYKTFENPPSEAEVLEALEEVRQANLGHPSACAYANIGDKWMRYGLDGSVAESRLSEQVAHL